MHSPNFRKRLLVGANPTRLSATQGYADSDAMHLVKTGFSLDRTAGFLHQIKTKRQPRTKRTKVASLQNQQQQEMQAMTNRMPLIKQRIRSTHSNCPRWKWSALPRWVRRVWRAKKYPATCSLPKTRKLTATKPCPCRIS